MQFSMKHCFAVLLNCASPNVRQAHTFARHVYVLATAPKQLQSVVTAQIDYMQWCFIYTERFDLGQRFKAASGNE